MTEDRETCGHDGGIGIGAGHRCRCICRPHHTTHHGCECGALWKKESAR